MCLFLYSVTIGETAHYWLSFPSQLFERVQTVFVDCVLVFLLPQFRANNYHVYLIKDSVT